MKSALIITIALSGFASAQNAAVTKNPNNNYLTGDLVMPWGRYLRVDGTLQTSQSPVLLGRSYADDWNGQAAFTSILSSDYGYHGLISRTQGNAGIAVIGLSETGACAGKFIQFYNFSSPTVYLGRDAASYPWWSPPTSPTLVVSTPADWTVTPIAEFKKNQSEVVLSIGSDGSVTAPYQQYTDSNALITQSFAGNNFIAKIGVNNGTNAAAGEVGEYSATSGSSTSLVTATAKTIHSVTLTAGDWDIEGVATYTKAATTVVTYTQQGISTTNNTLGGTGTFTATAAAISDVIPSAFTTPVVRLNLASTTTIYLVSRAGFTTSTLTASGFLRIRRVR
jgi:hypothetical protein